jgi:FdrA protein
MRVTVINEVRKGFYLDSVALMRLSRSIAGMDGIEEAALMMGTPANREILADAGLLAETGAAAGGGDLVIGIRAATEEAARAALAEAVAQLDKPAARGGDGEEWRPRTLRSAVAAMPDANLALISVPGDFAAAEARKAIRRGLHVMIFSDNVSLADEVALKREASELGCLVMGPDCGTAIINGTPLAFANAVPRGEIGIVGASGTGVQEVSCLIAQYGGGVSHAIGVGGRDLNADVGGISTLMAIDALDADAKTQAIVLISKPPPDDAAHAVLARIAQSGKSAIICFIGASEMAMPANATQVFSLKAAARAALRLDPGDTAPPGRMAARSGPVLGLFSGGTLCAEAQNLFRSAGHAVRSNAPIPGAADLSEANGGHALIDLGDDEFTRGRPHPMIDPSVRDAPVIDALARADLAAILFDVVIGYGAHTDPAGHLCALLRAHARPDGPPVFASVTGTEADPQVRSAQVAKLEAAGVFVAPTNADATLWALSAIGTGT